MVHGEILILNLRLLLSFAMSSRTGLRSTITNNLKLDTDLRSPNLFPYPWFRLHSSLTLGDIIWHLWAVPNRAVIYDTDTVWFVNRCVLVLYVNTLCDLHVTDRRRHGGLVRGWRGVLKIVRLGRVIKCTLLYWRQNPLASELPWCLAHLVAVGDLHGSDRLVVISRRYDSRPMALRGNHFQVRLLHIFV